MQNLMGTGLGSTAAAQPVVISYDKIKLEVEQLLKTINFDLIQEQQNNVIEQYMYAKSLNLKLRSQLEEIQYLKSQTLKTYQDQELVQKSIRTANRRLNLIGDYRPASDIPLLYKRLENLMKVE
ncbi:Hypothetical_protein [Hexamita inflata]|uniref:Hypothetical_protein n=1 Tax=Hexamita inflata TaxID=28002 RepID=A0AA86QG48_9EUKA|nr:Hypothetical protein HINF_LOCUS46384 [Hexamita inflata]